MKKIFISISIYFLSIGLMMSATTFSPSAKAFYDNYKNMHTKFNTLYTEYSSDTYDQAGNLMIQTKEITYKKGKKYRVSTSNLNSNTKNAIPFFAFDIIFDGKDVWSISVAGKQKIPGSNSDDVDFIKNFEINHDVYVDLKDEVLDGTKCSVLLISDNKTKNILSKVYISNKNNDVLKMFIKSDEGETEIINFDFKSQYNYRLPGKSIMSINGKKMSSKILIKSAVDDPIEDSIFDPDSIKVNAMSPENFMDLQKQLSEQTNS